MRIVQEALTFDDVLLIPAHSTVLPKNVALTTQLTRGIELKMPLVSAAMDTVTEGRLAISMAQEGGIGIVHKNMDAEQQAAQQKRLPDRNEAFCQPGERHLELEGLRWPPQQRVADLEGDVVHGRPGNAGN